MAESRIRALDGLRGAAAVAVVIGHARLAYLESGPDAWVYAPGVRHLSILFGTFGGTAVWLFFVLSGFVLTLMFVNKPKADYGTYILQRLARLYIPVWGAVIFAVVSVLFVSRDVDGLGSWVASHPKHLELWRIISDLTLVAGTGSNLTPLWSLRWEVLFSFVLIFYIAAARAIRPWLLIGGCFVLSIIGSIAPNSLLLYMPMFGIGVGFAMLWGRFQEWGDRIAERLPKTSGLLAVAALLAAVALQVLPQALTKLGVPTGAAQTAIGTGSRLASVALIVAIVGISATVGKVFASRVMVWLGMISFSLYLVHETVLLAAIYSTRSNPIALLIAMILCFPVAWVFYKLVEMPAHNFAKRIGSRQKDPVAA